MIFFIKNRWFFLKLTISNNWPNTSISTTAPVPEAPTLVSSSSSIITVLLLDLSVTVDSLIWSTLSESFIGSIDVFIGVEGFIVVVVVDFEEEEGEEGRVLSKGDSC